MDPGAPGGSSLPTNSMITTSSYHAPPARPPSSLVTSIPALAHNLFYPKRPTSTFPSPITATHSWSPSSSSCLALPWPSTRARGAEEVPGKKTRSLHMETHVLGRERYERLLGSRGISKLLCGFSLLFNKNKYSNRFGAHELISTFSEKVTSCGVL